MTWGEFYDCLEGYNDRIRRWRDDMDSLHHTLGTYISYAVNDPKHYPKEPLHLKVEEHERNTAHTDDERLRMARMKYGKKKEQHGNN